MNHFRQRPPAGSGPGAAGAPERERIEDLWPGYLEGGYFDADGHLRIEYVARERVEPLVQRMAESRPPLTSAQVRRFFQHCRRIESRLRSGEASWLDVRPQVVFLDAAAQDAFGKTPKKIPTLFHEFIRRNVAAICDEKAFLRGFLPHFEALVGFGSIHIRREGS
ncbi:MAG: type III-A CRISPR-associated protein Csm2 [Gemmatimonadetes bacterium]|nr:type III-A CRISPR-associated protein Csm2 [Gemmatimonadota bacterium]